VSLSTVQIYKSERYKVSIVADTKKEEEEEEVAVSLDSRIEIEHRRQKVKKTVSISEISGSRGSEYEV
jgi:hypothetical protein